MKKNKIYLPFCKGDFIVIFLVIMLAVFTGICFWINVCSVDGTLAVIYQDGERIQEIPLDREAEYVVTGAYQNTVCVESRRAAIVKSNCPGEDCVHSGWIQDAGRSIVCLPNRVEVRIEGTSETDFVVR